MNKVDDRVVKRVLEFIDFGNTENNKKKEYNKRDKFRNRKNWQDDKDILTQLTLLFYNRLENNTTTIIQSQENLEIQRENIKLLKENNELKIELESFKDTRKHNRLNREQINDLKLEIYNKDLLITQLQEKQKNKDKCVFDEPVTEVEHNYNPYPECDKDGNPINKDEEIYIPTTLKDFTGAEISNAKYTCGIEFWDSLDDDLKIQCLLQLR
jgi:hypothetical protein